MCTVVLFRDTPVSVFGPGWLGQCMFHPTGAQYSTMHAKTWMGTEWSQNHAATSRWCADTPTTTLQHTTPRLNTLFCPIERLTSVWPSALNWPKCRNLPGAGSYQLDGPVMCDVCKWFSKYTRMICFFFKKHLAKWFITIGIPTCKFLLIWGEKVKFLQKKGKMPMIYDTFVVFFEMGPYYNTFLKKSVRNHQNCSELFKIDPFIGELPNEIWRGKKCCFAWQ